MKIYFNYMQDFAIQVHLKRLHSLQMRKKVGLEHFPALLKATQSKF
jgi:hypothetical protein